MEVDTPYTVRFAGFSGGLSQQSVSRDRSGEPLTVRIGGDPEQAAGYRAGPMNDRRVFRTSPVRINSPTHPTTINRDAFGGIPLAVTAAGEITDAIESVSVSLRRGGVTVVPPVSVTPIVTAETNRLGAPINQFIAGIAIPVSVPDGDYELTAESFSLGSSRGVDVVRLHKDTTAPDVVSGADFSILATDSSIESFCVTASEDTVKVEILLDPSGTPIATSTSRSIVFGSSLSQLRSKFCFDPFDIPAAFTFGRNTWYLRLTDEAGNVTDPPLSGAFRIRPVITSIVPENPEPGQTVTIRGPGLNSFDAAGAVSFAGYEVPLLLGWRALDPQGTPLFSFSGFFPSTQPATLMRAPDFAEAGDMFLRMADGTASTSHRFKPCREPLSPFLADSLAERLELSLPDANLRMSRYVADIVSAPPISVQPVDGVAGVFPAGPVIAFVPENLNQIRVASWNGAEWVDNAIDTAGVQEELVPVPSLARAPNGEVAVAWSIIDHADLEIHLARRVPSLGNRPQWQASEVSRLAIATGVVLPNAVKLEFGPDGAAAIAFVGPTAAPPATSLGLYVAMESPAGSGTFQRFLVATETTGADGVRAVPTAPSLAFGENSLYVAWSEQFDSPSVPAILPAPRIHVVQVSDEGVVTSVGGEETSFCHGLPSGIWPSLRFVDGRPEIAYRGAVATPLGPVLKNLDWNRFDGACWSSHETVENLVDEITTRRVSTNPVDLGLAGGRITFSIGPASERRILFARPPGAAVVAKRLAADTWERRTLLLSNRLGASLGMSLDPDGSANVLTDEDYEESSSLRVIREDDGRSFDPGLETSCNEDAFERRGVSADIGGWIADRNRYPFSIDWLVDLPNFLSYVTSTSDRPPLEDEVRRLYVTAIAGEGMSPGGGFAESKYKVESTSLHTAFELQLPQARDSGERELEFLRGEVHWNDAHTPRTALIEARKAGANGSFVFTFDLLTIQQGPLCLIGDFPFVAGDLELDCGLTPQDVADLGAGGNTIQLMMVAGILSFVPPTEGLDNSNATINRLAAEIHGLRFSSRLSICRSLGPLSQEFCRR